MTMKGFLALALFPSQMAASRASVGVLSCTFGVTMTSSGLKESTLLRSPSDIIDWN